MCMYYLPLCTQTQGKKVGKMLQDQGIKCSLHLGGLGHCPLCVLTSCSHLLGTGLALIAQLLVLGVYMVTSGKALASHPAP